MVYPTEEVIRGLEASIRRAMGVRPMGMTTAILQRPVADGGAALCTGRTYPLFHHAAYYQRMMTRVGELSATQGEEFNGWRGTLLKSELEMKMVNWDRNPPTPAEDQQTKRWPLISTSAKAYGMIRRKLARMEIAKQDVNRVPLWNSSYFTTKTGTPYVSPKLLRKGVTTVGDIRRGRGVDEEKL